MVTGDGPATARAVASKLGIGTRVGLPADMERAAGEWDVFAGVLPEDKFKLVQALQRGGRVVGMTGDGVNDAPALKQAEIGIAVDSAVDVAKAAASVVLTASGLSGVLAAVDTGRRIYQRMLTYTLNKIVKTFHVALFLGVGFLLSGAVVTTPRHILLLLFTNDFVTMSLASDRVLPSSKPDRWDVRALVKRSLVIAGAWVTFSLAVFYVGQGLLHLPLPALQTLSFLVLVFAGQANLYLIRERRRFLAIQTQRVDAPGHRARLCFRLWVGRIRDPGRRGAPRAHRGAPARGLPFHGRARPGQSGALPPGREPSCVTIAQLGG